MTHVLVVDDAMTMRLFYRQVLEDGGVTIDEAVNGYEGLEKALQQPFDLLLIDVNMPKMDGYTFLRAVRREPALRSIPAIVISTEGREGDIRQGYAAGANLYLVKPVRPETLIRHVRMLTGRGAP